MNKSEESKVSDKARALRKEYLHSKLDESEANKDPLTQFERWFNEAVASEVVEPNAMVLATATSTGAPSARAVLLKHFDKAGYVFYSNYESRKAKDLEANPHVALLFYWGELERQIRIEGKASKLSHSESERYFRSRPRDSQLGALASPQSRVIRNRAVIEDRFAELSKLYENREVSFPAHWGGYLVRPDKIEFWQGRENRLHDRLLYCLNKSSEWEMVRLAP